MWNQFQKTLTIAHITILESIRRKDPYVVLILGIVMVLGAGIFNHFGVKGLDKFVKDVGFTVITIFSIVICVVAAARQFPQEIQNRSLYPSLGKPVSRTAFFFGKYLGVSVMSSAVVIAFFILFRILLRLFGISVNNLFYEAMYLRVLSMWFIAAGVLCLSLFTTQGATTTISLLTAMGMQMFAHSILYIHDDLTGIRQKLVEGIYWIAPHLELFDLSKKVIHGWLPIPLWVLGAMTLYCILYSAVFFALGCYRFRRMSL